MFLQIIENFRGEFRRCPALGMLLLYALGVAGFVCGAGWRGWIGLAHLSLWISWLGYGRKWWLAMGLFLFGCWWGWRHVNVPSYSYIRLLGREECRVSCRGRIVGHPLAGEAVDFSILELLTPSGWKSCSGLVRLKNSQTFSYGDEWQVTGGMTYPESDFYRRHLLTLGIRHELDCETAEKVALATGWRKAWGSFLKLRDVMAEKLTEGFCSQRLSGLYLAMVMGRRDLFSKSDRESFVRSATIHVFAISGLHVNCLMISTFLILRMLCMMKIWSRLLALPFVCLYVLLTGAGPSSMRALIMLCGAALSLGLYRRANNRHILCLSAFILLLSNPLYLCHIGFQFSFLIVGTLIYGQPLQKRVERVMMERRRWQLKTKWRIFVSQWMRRCIGMIFSCCLAWWGGLALTLNVNRLLPLGALMVNWSIQPMAALMVGMAVPKLLLSMVWARGACWLGGWLERCMEWMVSLAQWGGREALCFETTELPLEWACLFAVMMIVVLAGYQNRRLRLAGMAMMVCIVMIGLLQRPQKSAEIRGFRAETGRSASIIVLSQGWQRATVLTTGCEESAKMAVEWMKRNGVTKVDKLYAGNGTTARKGLHEWVAAMPIGSVVMDAEWRNADDVLRLMAEGVHVNVYDKTTAGYRHCHGREVCFLRCTVDGLSMRYEDAGNGMKLYYDEKEENMGLLSFINYNTGGNFIMMCGNPSPCLYVSVPLR